MNSLVVTRRVLCGAVLGAVLVLLLGVAVRPPDEPSTWLRLVLATYVGVLGWLVAGYAATNLRGQARLGRFAVLLVVAVGGLLTMVSAGGLVVSAIGWTVSGAATAALVAHRGDERARRAARVVASRLAWGDAALWLAVVAVLAGGGSAAGTTLASVLLAIAVLVRSASVPVQRWLPETAEAPSPVSALLHAGVVNGGAMFALVHWSVLAASPAALVVLAVAGVASVGAGLAAMRLRPDVKGRLAGSTTAQMGLVAVQLGLGLPAAALVHVLGHGCWKAWLFLRAGGAVDRARTSAADPDGPSRVHPVPVLAAVVVAGLAVGAVAPELALPGALTAAVAVLGLAEAGRIPRAGRGARLLVSALAVGVPAAYVGVLAVVDPAVHDAFAEGSAPPPVLAVAAAGLVVGIGLAASRLTPGSGGPIATVVAASLLPPGGTIRGRVRLTAAEPAASPGGLPASQLGTVVGIAATTVGPAWPLRSLVAANPLAPLENLAVEDAAATVSILCGRDPRPSLSTFLDLHAAGRISDAAVRRALAEQEPTGAEPRRSPHGGRPRTGALSGVGAADLVAFTRACADRSSVDGPVAVRACDRITVRRGRRPGEVLDLQVAAWAARAWSSTTVDARSPHDPWSLWLASARRRAHDLAWRVPGTSALARSLPDDPAAAIAALWPHVVELVGETDFYTYLAATLAAGRGWAAHAQWRERGADGTGALLQLAALSLALDVVVARAALDGGRATTSGPVDRAYGDRDAATTAELVGVWQRALDLTVRDGLLRDLTTSTPVSQEASAPDAAARPVHSVWCIDARSERMRRHLEVQGGHETYGYAGFFGLAVRHRDASGGVADLCPGILRPVTTTAERPSVPGVSASVRQLVGRIGHHPAAAFGWAEMSGVPALLGTLGATLAPGRWRALTTPARPAVPPELEPLPQEVAVDAAAQLLVATGLVARLGDGAVPGPEPLVVVGHGSSTENNAFASAYDCGACGGNSGRTNAALVAAALNDPLVRVALAERGLVVPPSVVAVAAVHDTTTDEVVLLRRRDDESPEVTTVLDALADDLARAGVAASAERARSLPTTGRRRRLAAVVDRGADWAESMPEWGLAGVRALVVGPRHLTAGRDLDGATFLHSYDASLDPDGQVLEQVMTGPVVVTHWISAQYYFSAAAPDLLGAGDKTTHNVVGDVGVMTGAHGDLRVGLPWQTVAGSDPLVDPAHLRHVPARHLVVLAADPARVRDIVTRHRELYEMVGNGWTQLVVVDGERRYLELDRHLGWRQCWIPSVPTSPSPPVRPSADPGDRSPSTAS
ncbi:putative inorganic carbon transporter subunit DabA [Nocardioides zeae]|uniref:DUF2309 family protein n=1 Tax=Nocardioides zeae TaxID=1457234 RepID=A0A6P0HF10_9ACTN|nr:putative inorganic carbon transporter subunit DabA [Nocardioides zeae]NEN77243.1 DUF2309 family protein [Nocardioides zeae]